MEEINNEANINGVEKSFSNAPKGYIGISGRFAQINKLITRDLNNNTSTPTFSRYSKDEIATYLENPYTYEKQLREAIVYIYGASPHFRRLIQYFVGLSDLSYIISPYKIDPQKQNATTLGRNYRKVLNIISSMNVRSQFPKILSVCLREDVFYGTMWVSDNNITIQQLPSDYCSIQSIEGNVLNVTFNFSYFDSHSNMLNFYPKEFQTKYSIYQKSRMNKWIDLDAPTSFAIKCNNDILDYPLPPFAGILREIYDIEDYKQLKATKTALENYAMVAMTLPMDEEGNWLIDEGKAKDFWSNLDSVLPEEIGSVMTPMPLSKISFEKSNTGDVDNVAEAEQNLFTAAGVSSLLFNNEKASANALLLSIKADQAITFGIVRSIEDMVNRYIQSRVEGRNFKVTFLDVSPYNRNEMGAQYLKACQFGMPMVSAYCASQGLSQEDFDSMNFLENDVIGIKTKLVPLLSSSNTSAEMLNESRGATDEGGAPTKGVGEISESGEQNQEDA